MLKGKQYMKGGKPFGNDDEKEGDDDEEKDDGDDEKGGMKYKGGAAKSAGNPHVYGSGDHDAYKSEVTTDDLEKSLAQLEGLAKSGDTDIRKQELLTKAQSGEDLEKSERDELFNLLSGDKPANSEPTLSEEVSKGMAGDEDLQKALDVSDYLQGQHEALCKSLETLSKAVESSDGRQHEFNLVLAGAVAKTGRLLKSLDERLSGIESAPARAPKSAGVPQGTPLLQKSFGDSDQSGEAQLSKSDVLDRMEAMMQKGQDDVGGESILHAAARYESLNQISPAMLEAVKRVATH